MLGDHARHPQAVGGKRIFAPSNPSQTFDRYGVTHGGGLAAWWN
jgi:hypothetical protein